jgi:hypothetical protein
MGLIDKVNGMHILCGALELIGVGYFSPVIRVGGRGWALKLAASRKDFSRNSFSRKWLFAYN